MKNKSIGLWIIGLVLIIGLFGSVEAEEIIVSDGNYLILWIIILCLIYSDSIQKYTSS